VKSKSPFEFSIGIQGCVTSHQQLGLAGDNLRVCDTILGCRLAFVILAPNACNLAPNACNVYDKFDHFESFLGAMTPL
jgi:hypothetical protein